jgi:hypothetical protein
MDRRTLFVFLAIIVLPSQGLPVTLDTIESCQQYDSFFEDASEAYNIPSNLLRAAALHESNCKQSEVNPNDGGCGVMQLTGTTKTNVASWFGVTEDELCENSSEGARLNILGGAAALDDFKCYASPRVITNDDLDNCASGLVPEALTDDEKIKLSETLEVWWWPIVQYNGGGADDHPFPTFS